MKTRRIFFRTGHPINGDEARAWAAVAMDGVQPGLVAHVMNYRPGSTQTRTDFPLVQFFGGAEGFGLLGFADDGMAAVDDVTLLLHKALSRQGGIVQIETATLSNSIETRPYAMRYRVPRMVVQKKSIHLDWLSDPVKGKAHIERLFLDSLRRQAEAMGLTIPDSATVEFMGAKGTLAAKPKQDLKLGLLTLKQAEFDLNLRLGGIWTVGYQLGKGYGHFNATHQLSGASTQEVTHALSQ